jgi:hypothetical protein
MVAMVALPTCTKWEVLEPTDDILDVEKLNVHIKFLFDDQKIEVSNENWNSAEIRIRRRISGWGEYTDVYHRRVLGRSAYSSVAYFDHGDKLWLQIEVFELDDNVVRNSYFELGKIIADADTSGSNSNCVIDTVLSL